MSKINTNVSALIAQHNLRKADNDLSTRLERLSTGLRINSGKDDPAGLIVSERLRGETAAIDTSIGNIERASNVIATTEGALQEVNDLLVDMRSLALEASNTGAFSQEEVEANQLQIDSALESINRIANTTSFAGLKLLDGGLDYITENAVASQITDIQIHAADFGSNESLPVNVEVLASAQRGTLFLSGDSGGVASGSLDQNISFELQGSEGVEAFSFASGTALSAVAHAINTRADATGVSATLPGTAADSGMILSTREFGSDAFVSVSKIDGGDDFALYREPGDNNTSGMRAEGEDVLALVNGNLALGKGQDVKLRTTGLDAEFSLTDAAAQTAGQTYSFDVTGGGSSFQIGPQVTSQQQVGFGIKSISPSSLGNSKVGFLSTLMSGEDNALTTGADAADQAQKAIRILDRATDQVSTLRGRLGAFERNMLQTTMRSSQIALENLTASESTIRDADFAKETSALTRAQILQQAGTETLGIANQTASNVLALLG